MSADNKSKPYNVNKKHKHVYLCARAPELRIVLKRKEKQGDREEYIGFLRSAAGGIFQTDSDELAKYIESLEWFEDGTITKMEHEELGELLSQTPVQDRVSEGALGTMRGSKTAPAAPSEQAPTTPKAAKAPRRVPTAA